MNELETCLKCGVTMRCWPSTDEPAIAIRHRAGGVYCELSQANIRNAKIEAEQEQLKDVYDRLHHKFMGLKAALSQPEKYPEIIKAEVKELFDCAIRENRDVKRQAKFAEGDLVKSKARNAELEAQVCYEQARFGDQVANSSMQIDELKAENAKLRETARKGKEE